MSWMVIFFQYYYEFIINIKCLSIHYNEGLVKGESFKLLSITSYKEFSSFEIRFYSAYSL